MKTRAQSAIEFLSTYAWALLIVAVLIGILLTLVTSPPGKQVLPSTCNIQPELPCQDSVLATLNATAPITYYITFTNGLTKPILIEPGKFNVTTSGIGVTGLQNSYGSCYPSFALPGTQVICKAAIPGSLAPSVGTKVSTLFSFSYILCPNNIQPQCAGLPVYQAAGSGLQDVSGASVARFLAVTFFINNTENGQVIDSNGVIILNGQQYTNGQTALLTSGGSLPIFAALPNAFKFEYWNTILPSTITPNDIPSSTLNLVSNTVVTAVSNEISHAQSYFVSIIASPSGGGTVSPNSGYYPKGTVLPISESNSPNFKFVQWTGSGTISYTGNAPTNTIVVNSPITDIASFTPIRPPPALVGNVPNLFVAAGEFGMTGAVYAINTTTGNLLKIIRVQGGPGGGGGGWYGGTSIAIAPDGSMLYVLGGPDYLFKINLTTYSIVNTIVFTGQPQLGSNGFSPEMALTPDGKEAFIEEASGFPMPTNILIADLTTNTFTQSPAKDFAPTIAGIASAVTSHGTEIYAANASNVMVLDSAGDLTANIVLPTASGPIAFAPDGSKAFIIAGNIIAIDTASRSILANIGVGGAASELGVSPNGDLLYVTNGDSVNVIDISTLTETNTIALPASGCCVHFTGATFTPNSSIAYVAGGGSGVLDRIDVASNTATAAPAQGVFSLEALINPTGATSGVGVLTLPNATVSSQYSLPGSPVSNDPCVYVGNSVSFSDTGASGGTPPYTYQWYESKYPTFTLTAIPGATSTSYIFNPTSSAQTGRWRFRLNATDAAGEKASVGVPSDFVYVFNAPNPATIFSPGQIIADPTSHYAYVIQDAACGQGYLTKLDLNTNSIVGSLQVSSNVPVALALAPGRGQAYVLNESAAGSTGPNGIISVVDLPTFTNSGTVQLPQTSAYSYYSSIAVTPDNNLAFVGDGNSISIVSLSSLSVTDTIGIANQIEEIAPYIDSNTLFASATDLSLDLGGIYTVNALSDSVSYTQTPFIPRSLAASLDGNYLFSDSGSSFYNMSIPGFTINANTLIPGSYAGTFALNHDGNAAYVQSSNTYVINIPGNSLIATIPGISGYVATGPPGYPFEYVAGFNALNGYSPGVFVVSTATNMVVNTIT